MSIFNNFNDLSSVICTITFVDKTFFEKDDIREACNWDKNNINN